MLVRIARQAELGLGQKLEKVRMLSKRNPAFYSARDFAN